MNHYPRAVLKDLYHQAEDYFLTTISQSQQHFTNVASVYLSSMASSSFNLLIVKRQEALSMAVLKEGIQLLEATGLPFSVVLAGDVMGLFAEQQAALKLTQAFSSTAMQLDMAQWVPQSVRCTGYEIACTDARMADWASPLESAFEAEPGFLQQYQARHQAAVGTSRQLTYFSLFAQNVPVCSLTLSIQNKVARLDDIGTRVGFHGRGYASALMQHALAYALSQHVAHCFLEASVQGASLYRRAGFISLFEYTGFKRQ